MWIEKPFPVMGALKYDQSVPRPRATTPWTFAPPSTHKTIRISLSPLGLPCQTPGPQAPTRIRNCGAALEASKGGSVASGTLIPSVCATCRTRAQIAPDGGRLATGGAAGARGAEGATA